MSIPSNLNKEHFLKAFDKIDKEGIPANGHSSTYDIDFNGNLYPPKLVVSYANLFANGKELDRAKFPGGKGTEAFKILKKFDFQIQNKNSKDYSIWIEKSKTEGRMDRLEGERALGKALWSPQKSRNGSDIYKNMRKVKPGDYILHLVDNSFFYGVSKVKKAAIDTTGVHATDWEGPAFLIELENYTKLQTPLEKEEILNQKNARELKEISEKSEVFYTSDLKLRQGAYLTPCSENLLNLINKSFLQKTNKTLPLIPASDIKNQALKEKNFSKRPSTSFTFLKFKTDSNNAGLLFPEKLISRFVASLCTKSFVILTGLSGSGKTKLAQSFTQWICENDNQYCIVPVGADWTNKEPLLGYPNALDDNDYVNPENGVLNLIKDAMRNPDLPYFLILDEMNLSHVERYFAEFLSAMESDEDISLHNGHEEKNGVPPKIILPSNLFIIGTVNIDETTYMFSPKVLDRANTIEFRVSEKELEDFFNDFIPLNLNGLKGQGANMAQNFLDISRKKKAGFDENLKATLLKFFNELKKTGAEFGYRTASEISTLYYQLQTIDESLTEDEKLDIAIMQKLLPKLHGSRRKLCPVLITLGSFCIEKELNIETEVFENSDFDLSSKAVKYPLSLEKIKRMYKGAIDHGFASYAEA